MADEHLIEFLQTDESLEWKGDFKWLNLVLFAKVAIVSDFTLFQKNKLWKGWSKGSTKSDSSWFLCQKWVFYKCVSVIFTVKLVRNRPAFFAEKLYRTMKGVSAGSLLTCSFCKGWYVIDLCRCINNFFIWNVSWIKPFHLLFAYEISNVMSIFIYDKKLLPCFLGGQTKMFITRIFSECKKS